MQGKTRQLLLFIPSEDSINKNYLSPRTQADVVVNLRGLTVTATQHPFLHERLLFWSSFLSDSALARRLCDTITPQRPPHLHGAAVSGTEGREWRRKGICASQLTQTLLIIPWTHSRSEITQMFDRCTATRDICCEGILFVLIFSSLIYDVRMGIKDEQTTTALQELARLSVWCSDPLRYRSSPAADWASLVWTHTRFLPQIILEYFTADRMTIPCYFYFSFTRYTQLFTTNNVVELLIYVVQVMISHYDTEKNVNYII